jgi:hypothetical protein
MNYPLYLSLLGENKSQVADYKYKRLSQNSCDKFGDRGREGRQYGGKAILVQTKKQAPAESRPSSSIKGSWRQYPGGAVRRESCGSASVSSVPWMAGSDSARGSRAYSSPVQRPPQHPPFCGGSISWGWVEPACFNNINALDGICSVSRIVARSTSDQILTKGRKTVRWMNPERASWSSPTGQTGSRRVPTEGWGRYTSLRPAPRLSLPLGPVLRSAPIVRPFIRSIDPPSDPARHPPPPSPPSVVSICPLATRPIKDVLLFLIFI